MPGELIVEPVDATLGAVVTGIDLHALTDAQWDEIRRAFLEHAVLVFPGQHLDDEAQKAFGRRFGPLEHIMGTDGALPLANLHRDGTPIDTTADPTYLNIRGNQDWHTDSSFRPVSAQASMLSARVLPSHGGETEWVDMRAAYDALPQPMRSRIEGLVAHHSIVRAQRLLGAVITEIPPGAYGDDGVGPVRPLVKVHPETGRPALFIGRHAYGIPTLDPDESAALLTELLDFACRAPRVYRHTWTVGDLVVWDNRCVLHRARPWDLRELRLMVHTRIGGDPATEAALA